MVVGASDATEIVDMRNMKCSITKNEGGNVNGEGFVTEATATVVDIKLIETTGPTRRVMRDTSLHESLLTVPTPDAQQCTVHRLHDNVKVYAHGGV